MKNMNYLKSLIVLAGLSLSMVACSPASPKLKPLPFIPTNTVDVKGQNVDVTNKIDILFVVDSSISMDSHQIKLKNNIDLFLQHFSQLSVDYQVGVITTDDKNNGCGWSSNNCAFLFGKLVNKSGEKIIKTTTVDGLNKLRSNILVGTRGSTTELAFDPIIEALSKSNLSSGGYNAGFIRDDAYLAIILITDADDSGSRASASQAFDFLVNLKSKRDKVLLYGVIVPSNDNYDCPRDMGSTPMPVEIEKFLSKSVNAKNASNIMNLCDPQYGTKLAGFSNDMLKYLTGTVYLTKIPVLKTIRVFFGTIELPSDRVKGWYYDADLNAIVLGSEVELDPKTPGFGAMRVVFDEATPPQKKNN